MLVCALCLLQSPARARQDAQSSPTPDEVQTRIDQLKGNGPTTPDNELLLFEENRKLEEEIHEARQSLSGLDTGKLHTDLKQLEEKAKALFQESDSVDCNKADAGRVSGLLSRYRVLVSALRNLVFSNDLEEVGDNPWTLGGAPQPGQPLDARESCARLKALLGDQSTNPSRRQELLTFFDKLGSEIDKLVEVNKNKVKQLGELLTLLQKRQSDIQQKLAKKDTQQVISGDLWKVILVIGLLSIGVILVVKVFGETTQVEWVASGQVIQFVTVMILLCVIMALGLANILKENTLGTLLGGIAGYVLSQGVGRAAAREATRKLDEVSDRQRRASSDAGNGTKKEPQDGRADGS
jgi:hypothetical protein